MRNAYAALLRLYPTEHQQMFANEMLDTFDRAAADWRRRGTLAFLCFTTWELTGLMQGLMIEWAAKKKAKQAYMSVCSQLEEEHDVPQDAAELEKRRARLVRKMEFAIAHHDFPAARFYSDKERIARAQLERLVSA